MSPVKPSPEYSLNATQIAITEDAVSLTALALVLMVNDAMILLF